jgi:hypothetical protein
MFVCAFILGLHCHVYRKRPCDELITRPRNATVCVKQITKLKKRPGPNKMAVEPLMNERMNEVCLFRQCSFCHIHRECYRRTVPSVADLFPA